MAGGNILAVLSGVGALIGFGGIVWKASEIKQEYDQQFQVLDSRVDNVEAISPEADGSAVLRRITALEQRINSLSEDNARLQADVGQLDSSASGLGGQLAERVNDLEMQLAELEGAGSPNPTGMSSDLDARVSSIEQRLNAMGASSVEGARRVNTSGAGPALVNTDFRADVQGLDFRLIGCRGQSAPVCTFTIENTTNSDINTGIANDGGQNDTHAYSQSSEFFEGLRGRIGPSEREDPLVSIPAGLRMEGYVRFAQTNQPVEYMQILRIEFYNPGQWVEFRNVPVE